MKPNIRIILSLIYALILVADFIIFPLVWNTIQYFQNIPITSYEPITLREAAAIHIIFGAYIVAQYFPKK